MQLAELQAGRFTDTDKLLAAAPSWDLDFRQLDGGPLDASLDRALSLRCGIQRVSFSRRFHQNGAPPKGFLTFGAPDSASSLLWYGRRSDPNTYLNFNREHGLESVSEAGFVGSTYSVSDEVFNAESDAMGLSTSADHVRSGAQSFVLEPGVWLAIARTRNSIFDVLHGGDVAAKASVELEHDLVHMMVRAIGGQSATRVHLDYSDRQKAVSRALAYIEAVPVLQNISELFRESQVSWRTLDRGFKERFGVSPKQYVTTRRLYRVRQDLQNASRDDTVSDIAYRWGFWHLGRFSASYRRMFGELPSESLAKAPGRG